MRDDILESTPLRWACRWGRAGVAKVMLERGADPVEVDAEPWARPRGVGGEDGTRRRSHGATGARLLISSNYTPLTPRCLLEIRNVGR